MVQGTCAKCAATHPPLDALLHLKRDHDLIADQIAAIDVEADSMTARLLSYSRPSTALEAKFSMPFCAAAAMVCGHPTLETFDREKIRDPRIQKLLPLVTLRANPDFDHAAPLSQADVTVRLRDGRTVRDRADGARGYPGGLTDDELHTKFLACAGRSLPHTAAVRVLDALRTVESMPAIAALTQLCSIDRSADVSDER